MGLTKVQRCATIFASMANKVAEEKQTFLANLTKKLVGIQSSEALSDYRFAAKLGISRQLWQFIRTGTKPIGLTLLKAMARTYPELDKEILKFLRDSNEPG